PPSTVRVPPGPSYWLNKAIAAPFSTRMLSALMFTAGGSPGPKRFVCTEAKPDRFTDPASIVISGTLAGGKDEGETKDPANVRMPGGAFVNGSGAVPVMLTS